jgi:hypothetical protein
VKLSGGTNGTIYNVVSRITTAVNAEGLDQTIQIYVKDE